MCVTEQREEKYSGTDMSLMLVAAMPMQALYHWKCRNTYLLLFRYSSYASNFFFSLERERRGIFLPLCLTAESRHVNPNETHEKELMRLFCRFSVCVR